VILADTPKASRNLFELQHVKSRRLKGVTQPVLPGWSIEQSRGEPLRSAGATVLTPLVGRKRKWTYCSAAGQGKAGAGQVVLISGEAVSQVAAHAELLERIAAEPHTRLRYFSSPQHTDSALYLIISRIERAAAFTMTHNANKTRQA